MLAVGFGVTLHPSRGFDAHRRCHDLFFFHNTVFFLRVIRDVLSLPTDVVDGHHGRRVFLVSADNRKENKKRENMKESEENMKESKNRREKSTL